MKRYSILCIDASQGNAELELCQCDSNPMAIVEAVKDKKIRAKDAYGKPSTILRYTGLRIVDNMPDANSDHGHRTDRPGVDQAAP